MKRVIFKILQRFFMLSDLLYRKLLNQEMYAKRYTSNILISDVTGNELLLLYKLLSIV